MTVLIIPVLSRSPPYNEAALSSGGNEGKMYTAGDEGLKQTFYFAHSACYKPDLGLVYIVLC